jgi:hypothetical protein
MEVFKMFGLEYIMAIIKIAFNVAFSIVSAIPFYYSWNCIAPKYLTFIPKLYQSVPYWHIVAFFLVCTFLGEQITKLFPNLVFISQTNDNR